MLIEVFPQADVWVIVSGFYNSVIMATSKKQS